MSGHHYFKQFGCCDSGLLPWLLWLQIQAQSSTDLSEKIRERAALFPVSGEINRSVSDQQAVLKRVREHYAPLAVASTDIDGVSYDFADWRFNLRSSNTEPLIRLNVETRANADLLRKKTDELLACVEESS